MVGVVGVGAVAVAVAVPPIGSTDSMLLITTDVDVEGDGVG